MENIWAYMLYLNLTTPKQFYKYIGESKLFEAFYKQIKQSLFS